MAEREGPSRSPDVRRRIPFVLAALCIVVGTGSASGGYFPSTWAWISLIALWGAALFLLMGQPALGAPHFAFLTSLGLFVTWVGLSAAWSDPSTALRELERDLSYVAVALAAILIVRRANAGAIFVGLWAGAGLLSLYSLVTRLFPDRVGSYDPVAVYRLAAPVGYWNALGVLMAIGIVLALGMLTQQSSVLGQAVACASVVVLGTTLYFTYSRGAVGALVVGLAALLAIGPGRLRAIIAIFAAVPAAATAVLIASHQHPLTTQHVTIATAAHAGHRFGIWLLILTLAGGALGAGLHLLRSHITPAPRVKVAFAALVTLVALSGCVLGAMKYGNPVVAARHAWHAFEAPPPKLDANLNARLFSFSGNGRAALWRSSWKDFKGHPLAGTGAGSFERPWLRGRPVALKVRDAHSLYIESLGELGIIGFALLALALVVPLSAAIRARHHVLAPFAFAAYATLLAHAAVDWDWEMPVLMVTGLVLAVLLLAWGGGEGPTISGRVRALFLALVGVGLLFALVTLVGNMALARASTAASRGDWKASARDAELAHAWAPWSSEPYRVLGEARLGEGNTNAAVASFKRAIGKSADDWNLWFDLARATTGGAQKDALRHAKVLNPLSPEVAQLEAELAAEGVITVTGK